MKLDDFRNNPEQFLEGAEQAARTYWPVLLVEGIALVLFGLLALFIPPLVTLGMVSSLGWVFLFGGTAALLTYFQYQTPGFRRRLFLAVLSVIVGLALLIRPLSGVISLTVFLIGCFALGGAVKLTYPLKDSRYFSRYSGWIRFSGVVDILIAGLMFFELSETALWAPGLLLGANMILAGMALVAVALMERVNPALKRTDR